jgi:hypothetical protein
LGILRFNSQKNPAFTEIQSIKRIRKNMELLEVGQVFFFFFFFLTSFSSFRLLELYQTGLELARKIFSKEQIFLKTSKKNLRRLNLGDLASAFFILVIEISMSFVAFLG